MLARVKCALALFTHVTYYDLVCMEYIVEFRGHIDQKKGKGVGGGGGSPGTQCSYSYRGLTSA